MDEPYTVFKTNLEIMSLEVIVQQAEAAKADRQARMQSANMK